MANCQQVNKWWCNFVHNGKSLLIRKIQRHVCISKEKFRKSLNKLSLEVPTKFEYYARMHRRFADSRNRESFLQKNNLKNREPYTVEECRKQVFIKLITYPDQDPCIPIVCNLMSWVRLRGPVIQANGRLIFENDLRSGGLLGFTTQ